MEPMKSPSLRWLLIIAVSGTLLGGAAARPQMRRCYDCEPCGCWPDGSSILCCSEVPKC
jgi:hypothetical protein